MCEPATIATIALAASAGSAVIGAVGAEKQAAAQKAAADYSAQVAANNAIIAGEKARVTSAAGEQQSANEGQKTRQEVGAIKAAQAANNVDVNSGSAVDVRSTAAETGQLNALTIRSNAAREAYGYATQANSFDAQSKLDTAQGEWASQAGDINALSSVLGGASSTAGKYASFKAAGAI